MKKLAIITTHPIQYNAPWFAMLAKANTVQLKVFYTWSQKEKDNYDPDFKQNIAWDIPLLSGYDYTFVKNTSKNPGAHHYKGITCPSLIKAVEDWKPTHILVFGWNYKAHFKTMRHFKGRLPVLFRGDSTLLDYEVKSIKSLVASIKKNNYNSSILSQLKAYGKYKLRKAFLSYICRHIDTALYVGQNNKAYFTEHGLKKEQLVFVPHAIDNDRFLDNDEKQYGAKAKLWKTELGIKEEDMVLLYAGKFEPRKNLLFFLNTFNEICLSSNKKLKLILLGNGPLENEVLRLAKQNKENIICLPFQNQSMMPIVYRLSNFYCLPSQSETWGLAINEALACGRPVLVSDKVGCAVDMVNAKTGLIFKSNCNESLGESLLGIKRIHPEWDASQWSFQCITNNISNYLNA